MITKDPKPWEVWWAEVKYEDSDVVEVRPILIDDKHRGIVIAFKITSHDPRDEWGEYPLARWRECGLYKESTVRLGHVVNVKLDKCKNKAGTLHYIDIINIRNILASSKYNDKLNRL